MKFDNLYATLLEKASTHNNAYVFDFDQTLAETGAKIGVIRDGQIYRRLTSQAFNTYVLKSGESFEFSEFDDGDKVLNKSKLLPYFYVMKNIYKRIQNAENKVNRIYILTARSSPVKNALYSLLERHNIVIPIENIYTIGDQLKSGQTIAERKKEILKKLSDKYDEVTFFDDDERNILLAKAIGPNVKTRHNYSNSYK